jgi:DNA-binding winged helix-turn-helix (wHTH) protein
MLDFGPSSEDGWLSRLVAMELQIEDDSILDLAQHQLILDGGRVDLTKLEFDVMSYLYLRQGVVVERADLLRDVWGYDDAGGSNVIEANVRSLRRKLGDRAASIETVRGLGYRFSAASYANSHLPDDCDHEVAVAGPDAEQDIVGRGLAAVDVVEVVGDDERQADLRREPEELLGVQSPRRVGADHGPR